MDAQGFDTLARSVTTARSRRSALRTLTGGLFAGGAAAALVRSAGAQQQCQSERQKCRFDNDCCNGLTCQGRGRCRYINRCGGKGRDYCGSNKDCCDGYRCRRNECRRCKTRQQRCDSDPDCCPGFQCQGGICRG